MKALNTKLHLAKVAAAANVTALRAAHSVAVTDSQIAEVMLLELLTQAVELRTRIESLAAAAEREAANG